MERKHYIYLVKVFNVIQEVYGNTTEEETVAACTDKNRAEEILKYNIAGVDDGYYNYGLIVTVADGRVYGEINPIDLSVYKYNKKENSFETLSYYNDVTLTVKKNYCFRLDF